MRKRLRSIQSAGHRMNPTNHRYVRFLAILLMAASSLRAWDLIHTHSEPSCSDRAKQCHSTEAGTCAGYDDATHEEHGDNAGNTCRICELVAVISGGLFTTPPSQLLISTGPPSPSIDAPLLLSGLREWSARSTRGPPLFT